MLQLIRDRATGWIAWGIVILISVPFALWGISDYFGFGQASSVAEVNGTELSVQEYNLAFQRQRQRLQRMLGENISVDDFDESFIRRQSLDALIRDTLLVQFGGDNNLRISDEQLARAIQVQQPFQLDGEFNQGLYESWLRSQGYSSGGFEYELRRSLLIEQIVAGIGGSAITTSREKNRLAALRDQTRDFHEFMVNRRQFEAIDVADDEVQAYFEDKAGSFNTAETVNLEYVLISLDVLAADIASNDVALKELYEASRLNYTEPEKRKASHILIRLGPDDDESSVQAVTESIETIQGRLNAGEDFADLARELSQDPGSAANGGDLGYFERGIMDPAFEASVFSLEQGAISEPVRSAFGLHLIQLVEIVEGRTRTFEEAREEILAEYQRREAEQIYFEQVENLASLAFEVPDTLEVAADALGLEILTVDGVGRSGSLADFVASDPDVVEAAFSADVLTEGNNSDVIELPGGQAVVLRVAEHSPSRPQTFAEARDQILRQLKTESAKAQASRVGQELLSSLKNGASEESAVVGIEGEWEDRTAVSRQASGVGVDVREFVFSLPRPTEGASVIEGIELRSGDFVVVVLRSVADGDPSALQADRLNAIESDLVADYGGTAFDGFVTRLRSQADVVVNEETVGQGSSY